MAAACMVAGPRAVSSVFTSYAGGMFVISATLALGVRFGAIHVGQYQAYTQHFLFGLGFPVFVTMVFASAIPVKKSGFPVLVANPRALGFLMLSLLPSIAWETAQCFIESLPTFISRLMYAAEPGRFQWDQLIFEIAGIAVFFLFAKL